MATFRCPKHDLIFEAGIDQRKPGALASPDGKLAAHPHDGHPECPLCEKETHTPAAVAGVRRIG